MQNINYNFIFYMIQYNMIDDLHWKTDRQAKN